MSEGKKPTDVAEATDPVLSQLECFKAEKHGDVIVLRSKKRKLIEKEVILGAKAEMFQLAGKGYKIVIIDFCTVELVSSDFLAALIALDKRIKALGGKLVMCSIPRAIYEVFAIIRLDRLFCIKQNLEEALAEF